MANANEKRYWTFQVVLHRKPEGTDDNEAHEFRDCDDMGVKELRNDVWTKGLKIQHGPKAWEVISPFMVKSAFIILQDRKYNP